MNQDFLKLAARVKALRREDRVATAKMSDATAEWTEVNKALTAVNDEMKQYLATLLKNETTPEEWPAK